MRIFDSVELEGGIKLYMQVVLMEKSIFAWAKGEDTLEVGRGTGPKPGVCGGKMGGISVAMPGREVY